MLTAQAVKDHLPILRRYARALTGSQESGDSYVAAALEALTEDPSAIDQQTSVRVGMFRVFSKIWNSLEVNATGKEPINPRPADRHLGQIGAMPRQAFLLVSLEGFSEEDAAKILDVSANKVRDLIDECGRELASQIATNILIIEDEALIAMDLQSLVENLGHEVKGIARTRSEAVALAKRTAEQVKLGDPLDPATQMGPLVSKAQFDKVQGLIEKGIQEGATLVTGGTGRPAGFNRGYFVRPTVFADVTPNMTIAKEEIFGPVLSMMTYGTEDQAIKMANKTSYGLAGYVQAGDIADARRVASKIRAGCVYLNGAPADRSVPFGGYKQSGNGREHGVFGLEEYLEVKAVLGYQTA